MNRVPPWLVALIGCALLAAITTGTLPLHAASEALGYPGGDQMDLARLRLAVARAPFAGHSDQILAPTGYELGALLPNRLDHWTGAPLALALPWPLADNLWWWGVITTNAFAAWALGRRIGGSPAAGALTAIAFCWCEPLLREIDQAHGPQALVAWSPWFVLALWSVTSPEGRRRDAVALGLAAALSGLTWWYQPLFLAFAAAPVVAAAMWRAEVPRRELLLRFAIAVGLAAVLVAPALTVAIGQHGVDSGAEALPWNRGDLALRRIPEAHRWTFGQGGDLFWWLGTGISDRASRVSLVLIAAAIAGARGGPWRRWVAGALVGAVFVFGPFLKFGQNPILIAGHPIPLPGLALAEISDLFARLHWPQRWAIVVPLFLLPLAARAPRPGRWAAALALETLLLSSHFPLSTTPVGQLDGWRALAGAPGSVLVVPTDPRGPSEPWVGFAYRAATVPLISTFRTPRWAPWPHEWLEWRAQEPVERWLGDRADQNAPIATADLDRLRADGVAAIALDLTPGGPVRAVEAPKLTTQLSFALSDLGPPDDFGSVLVWWLDPPATRPPPLAEADAWRARWREALFHRQRSYSKEVGVTWILDPPRPPPP